MMPAAQRIKALVQGHPVVLFMKGTPQLPMCGFSSRAVEVLGRVEAPITHVNVLADPEVRADLPRYSDWPTFPQLFVNGEFIGGCDILEDLYESGELRRIIDDAHKGGA